MKKLFFISAVILSLPEGKGGWGWAAFAQQLPYFSQYMYSELYINPAVAGSKEGIPVMMTFRRQWAGLDGAPMTNTISGHSAFLKNMGAGVILMDDRTGPLTQTGAQLSYAYRVKFSDDTKLSFGLGGMFYQHVLDKGTLKIEDKGDKVIQGGKEKAFSPDVTFGMHLKYKRFSAGFSTPQLFQTNMKFTEYADLRLRLVRHYFFYSAYRIELNEKIKTEPSVLLKAVDGAPVQFDANLRVEYKEHVWLGASYRNKESIIGMAGVKAGIFSVGYSYDFTLSNIKKYSTGSHEIFISFDVKTSPKVSEARFD